MLVSAMAALCNIFTACLLSSCTRKEKMMGEEQLKPASQISQADQQRPYEFKLMYYTNLGKLVK